MATSLNNPSRPQRGEVWLVTFDPTLGAEIKKVRPAVVVSSNVVGRLPLKLVAPITDWKEAYAPDLWHIRLLPDAINGLTKESAVDVLQVRGLDELRFIRRLGRLSDELMEQVVWAIADVIECP